MLARSRQLVRLMVVLCATLLAITPAPSLAQTEVRRGDLLDDELFAFDAIEDQLQAFAGRPIASIDLVLESPPDDPAADLDPRSRQLAMNQLRSAVGEPLRPETVSDDVRRLGRTGHFDQASARLTLLTDGSVALEYVLTLQPIIRDVQVVGNTSISDSDIAKVIDLVVGAPVERHRLDISCRAIEGLYREKGFYRAQVTVDEPELRETGIVLFRIQEAQRVRITDIRFDGNEAFGSRRLRSEVRTEESGFFNRGTLDFNAVAEDVASLREFYVNRGYLDVRVSHAITESPNGKEAILTFVIYEGDVYTLRNVSVQYFNSPRPSIDAEQIKGLMIIRPGDVYAQNLLDQSVDSIRAAFGKMGYVDARVLKQELRDPGLPLVDLQVLVQQGERYKTGEVIIQGNSITNQRVIRRNIELKPNRPLDTTKLERSKQKLTNSRLFELRDNPPRLTIQRPDENDPIYRDVLVQVAETNTGNFNFGAQVSSDAGLTARIGVEQRNFDITDLPDSFGEFLAGRAFRGGGQTFRLELLPGTEVQTYLISLEEPAIFDSDYSGSGTLAYNRRIFSEYDQESVGFRLGAGRRFGDRWSGALSLRGEDVRLFNISTGAPAEYYQYAEKSFVNSIGASLVRTTLDNNFRPGKGTRTELGVEQFGLAGDYNFTKLDAEHKVYLTLNEDFDGRRTILKLDTRAGYIPQNVDGVPVYERYYMGGQDFRGFAFRTVSPKGLDLNGNQTDEPVGGVWMLFAGAQIEQPIFSDSFSIVGFVDTGTVSNSVGITDYRVSVGTGFRIAITALSPVPLAFDFGFHIIKQDLDQDRLFTFTVDLPF